MRGEDYGVGLTMLLTIVLVVFGGYYGYQQVRAKIIQPDIMNEQTTALKGIQSELSGIRQELTLMRTEKTKP
jgi:hypothetical protein